MYTAENAPGVAVLLSGDADVPGPLTGLPTHLGQSIPSGRRVQHRRQPGTHVQARRIDLRGQHREAHLASLTGTADHHRVVGGAKRPVPRLGVLTVTIIQQTPDAGLALECRDRKSQLGLAGQ